MALSTAVIVFEGEDAARRRLEAFGYAPDVAAEIAVYLAQATDLPEFADDITDALRAEGIEAEFTPLDALPSRLRDLGPRRDETIVWALTDGGRFYRGSSVPALARLGGFARYGSPATAAHLCQDKFAGLALASAAGLAVPPTRLMEGGSEIAALGSWPHASGPLFVKPNTLGAKIGIFADSLCKTADEAKELAKRIWDRYRDRALIQPFVQGDDVRVSFMDLGGDLAGQLGVERILKNPASETGGAFLTMKDNETLSGARDTDGARGGFGLTHEAAFVPRMMDLRDAKDERSRNALAAIVEASVRLAGLLRLCDCFSMDFRFDAEARPTFFEFEVCPAVTIYDFQSYLGRRGLTLGAALAKSMRLAFAKRGAVDEA
jgi:D-alanine-D-alanine ligase-like ATP-grasp enzyme